MIAQCNILNIGDILILDNGLIGLICIIQCIDELDVNLLIFLCGFAEIDRIAVVFLDRLISQRYLNGMRCTDPSHSAKDSPAGYPLHNQNNTQPHY